MKSLKNKKSFFSPSGCFAILNIEKGRMKNGNMGQVS
jgi:hypothetical protein